MTVTDSQTIPIGQSPLVDLSSASVSSRPLWRLAWSRMRQRPLQYLLCIVGIALGVAMMISIDLANGSAQRAFALSTDAITGQSTHRIAAIAPSGVEDSVYGQLRLEVSSASIAPVVEGYGVAPELGNQPFRLVGVDLRAEAPFRQHFGDELDANGLVNFLTQPNVVVLEQTVASQYGVQLGDRLDFEVSGQAHSLRVVGLLDDPSALNRRALSNILFTDIATAQEVLDKRGYLSYIDVIAETPETIAEIAEHLPQGVSLEPAEAQKNAVKQMTAAFELNLTALSLLALVVGMFLIYNTVTFSVIQRRSLFGVLRCLGVTQGQLFTLILGEAFIFSLVGSALGIGLGIGLGRSIVGLITQTINDFYFVVSVQQVTLAQSTLAKGAIVGVAAAVLASVLPAWEAMSTPPQMTLQRSSLEQKVTRFMPWLVAVWLGLTLLGVVLLRWAAGGLIAAFGGLSAILLGAAALTPPLTLALMGWVAPTAPTLFGVIGRMAPRDIVRSLSRTSVAISALMVAVSVIVGVSIMIGSFRTTVVQWLDQTLQADVYVSPPQSTANRVLGKLDPAVVAAVKAWPGVTDAVTYNDGEARVLDFDRQAKLIVADGDVSHGQRPYAWIRDGLQNPWDLLSDGKGVILSEALLWRENLSQPPETITLQAPDGPVSFPVLAVFYDYSSDQGTVIIDNDVYIQHWRDDTVASIGLFLEPDADVETIVSAIKARFQGRQDLSVQSNRALRQGSLEIFDRTFAITNALRLLAIVVAFIGVLSTLMSLQLERTRELGILRAMGMTPRQMGGMMLLATGLMGMVSGLLAMPLGYVLAWILVYVINVRSFGWTLQMVLQGQYFWQAFLVSVLAALLAGVYPAWRLAQMNIAAAVRQE